jgi:xanthine/CO dehydrogenase XdhC/CoxF family maturation factor
MTHRFTEDGAYLEQLLNANLPYIGILGPRRRTERLLGQLAQTNPNFTLSPNQRARIFSPIGLDIGSESAPTIALAIVAEIQAVLAQRTGQPLTQKTGPIHAAFPAAEAPCPT